MNKNYYKKPAFTLIELLVVVAIIGVLATLAVVSLQSTRAQARDAKRIADIKQIQTALELYFNDQGYYPASTSVTSSIFYEDSVYMARLPKAPTPADGDCNSEENKYIYSEQGTDNGSYFISFCLGNKVGSFNNNNKCAFPGGIYDFACGESEEETILTKGTSYQGGLIFYLDSDWGLIVSPEYLEHSRFSDAYGEAGTDYAIGTGEANTLAIISQAGHTVSAAKACNDLVSAGYDDWFLPSRDELIEVSIETSSETGFISGCWSSSEYDGSPNNGAIIVNLETAIYYDEAKGMNDKVICIRKFTF